MTDKIVTVLSGNSGNGAIFGLMSQVVQLIQQQGRAAKLLDIHKASESDLAAFGELVQSGGVDFVVSYLGFGQDFAVPDNNGTLHNIWDFFGVPFLKLHGDMPAYYPARHRALPIRSANIYPCEEFLSQRKWLDPFEHCADFISSPMVVDGVKLEDIDFASRSQGDVVFVKNGGSPDALRELWGRQLPPHITRLLNGAAEAIAPLSLRPGGVSLIEFIEDFMLAERMEPRGVPRLRRLMAAQLDDFTRRIKSTLIARALLDFPVVIQGDRWEHIATLPKKATLRAARDFVDSQDVYNQALAIIDMSPNIETACHDRVARSAGNYSMVLTNRTTWLGSVSTTLSNKAFDFNPESISSSVDWVLSHREEAVEIGREFGSVFRRRHPGNAFASELLNIAEIVRFEHATASPQLQGYYVG